MASIKERKDKSGAVISYEISVFKCRTRTASRYFIELHGGHSPDGASARSTASWPILPAILSGIAKRAVYSPSRTGPKKAAGGRGGAAKITLQKYATETFMPRKSATFSETTKDTYTRCFERIFHYLGSLRMEDIRPVDITNFLLALQTKENRKAECGEGNQGHRQAIILWDDHQALHCPSFHVRSAFMDDVIPANPMDKVERPKPERMMQRRKSRPWTLRRPAVCCNAFPKSRCNGKHYSPYAGQRLQAWGNLWAALALRGLHQQHDHD